MLKGNFKNCYGIADFTLEEIPFDPTTDGKNKAVIYAPNGVIKSSLAKVFDDLHKKQKSKDRIFENAVSTFEIDYYSSHFVNDGKKAAENIYVIQSFDEKFEASPDSISTILADDSVRKKYEDVIKLNDVEIKKLIDALSEVSGISKQKIKLSIALDVNVEEDSDWKNIFAKLIECSQTHQLKEVLADLKYSDLFCEQTARVYSNPKFIKTIMSYIDMIDELIDKSEFLSKDFNDHNVSEFGKTLDRQHFFNAKHKIVTRNNIEISNYIEWNSIVEKEFNRIYETPEIKQIFEDISKLLNANEQTRKLKEILLNNRSIIPLFGDISTLRLSLWHSYCSEKGLDISHYLKLMEKQDEELIKLREQAQNQLKYWEKVVSEFKYRFRTPFDVSIQNQDDVVLSGEPAKLVFTYVRGTDKITKNKEVLMTCLSQGEKRALYLLHILFDLEKLKDSIRRKGQKYLIVADDIADSFDYGNKYAIIEYLKEYADNRFIDLLILTHNFDFFRTVQSRLSINRDFCFIVQKLENSQLEMQKFPYLKDYFQKVILDNVKDGDIGQDNEKIKKFMSLIPFSRNLCEYLGKESEYVFLTSLLHIKSDSANVTCDDLWNNIKSIYPNFGELSIDKHYPDKVLELIHMSATRIASSGNIGICLEDKIVLSIAVRLKAEEFLKKSLSQMVLI